SENNMSGRKLLIGWLTRATPKPAATRARALTAPSASLTIRGVNPDCWLTVCSQSPYAGYNRFKPMKGCSLRTGKRICDRTACGWDFGDATVTGCLYQLAERSIIQGSADR